MEYEALKYSFSARWEDGHSLAPRCSTELRVPPAEPRAWCLLSGGSKAPTLPDAHHGSSTGLWLCRDGLVTVSGIGNRASPGETASTS